MDEYPYEAIHIVLTQFDSNFGFRLVKTKGPNYLYVKGRTKVIFPKMPKYSGDILEKLANDIGIKYSEFVGLLGATTAHLKSNAGKGS